jgi:hypothetical protein
VRFCWLCLVFTRLVVFWVFETFFCSNIGFEPFLEWLWPISSFANCDPIWECERPDDVSLEIDLSEVWISADYDLVELLLFLLILSILKSKLVEFDFEVLSDWFWRVSLRAVGDFLPAYAAVKVEFLAVKLLEFWIKLLVVADWFACFWAV